MQTNEPIRSILRRKSSELYWLSPDASVYEAIALMSAKSAGALLVLEGDRLVGIISERDYARKVVLMGKSSRDTLIREIMSTPVFHVNPNTSVEDCMRLMTERRIRHLPVVENEKVTGIVSIGDLVKWTLSEQKNQIQHLESFIAGAYPG
ncbi:MAG TPA: CBS domain-containing protein [Bryobacteraceae bacterium]|nr:CBS domain-containing protein [Bryobacteraceae bacterium]